MSMSENSPESTNQENSTTDDERCAITHDRSCGSSKTFLTEAKMRRKLQFFFMNPIEKWEAKKRFPYKFFVQVVKIILVTLQLCLFAYTRYNHVNYTWDNKLTFSHLFLKDWDATREVNAYPPSVGPLAVYKIEDFYSTIDYAVKGYSDLDKAVGSYSYANEDNSMPPIVCCISQYKQGIIHGFNESYVFDPEIIRACHNLTNPPSGQFSAQDFLVDKMNFAALVKASLHFSIKTINFKAAGRITPPNCYRFYVQISFDNVDHDGQLLLTLDAEPLRLECKGDTHYVTDSEIQSILRSLLNYLVIITCIVSFILCGRALWRAQQLRKVTEKFFASNFDKKLGYHDKLKFCNLWYVMIIVNDVFITFGSIIKEQIERKHFTSDQWNACSMLLGLGNMLVWFGVLRYLGFFRKYNVIILTLQRAAPDVARFLLCALLIYAGFTFCGWLILGPYHFKFRSLSTTSECLFSLINGDDMFATFSIMSNKSAILWWFSRIYLYSFISLNIYVVLSLFITLIMDAYETIKLHYQEGFPKSDLENFIGDTNLDDLSNGIYRTTSNDSLGDIMKDLCCCKHIHRSYSSLSRTSVKTDDDRERQNAIPV